MKRLIDVVGATAALFVCAPVVIVSAALVKCDSGPAFYRQKRIGREGKTFGILKLRTMVVGAEEMLDDDANLREEYLSNYSIVNDPRITHIGKMLRYTYLDELPQLINVLRGEMSLIGPRPVLHEETLRYGDHKDLILSVRPGMTGWWQISRRRDTTYDERIRMEIWYVRNRSLILDFRIVLRTLTYLYRSTIDRILSGNGDKII